MTTRKSNTQSSTQSTAQQEELKKMRARKAEAIDADPDPVFADSTVGHELNNDAGFGAMAGDMAAMLGLPSWKRALIGFITSTAVASAVAYGGSMVVSLIMAGATASGFYFLGLAMAVLAVIIAAYFTLRAGAKTMGYICSGKIDEHAVAVKNKVVGWFTPFKTA